MLRFYAAKYVELSHKMTAVEWAFSEHAAKHGDLVVAQGDREGFLGLLDVIEQNCIPVGLKGPVKEARRARDVAKTADFTYRDASERIARLWERLAEDLEESMIWRVDPDAADDFDISSLGEDIDVAFPKISFDITEAYRCLALDRGTACVFHLMRIMEAGLLKIGVDALGVAPETRGWEVILRIAKKNLDGRRSGDAKDALLDQTLAQLYAVKDAWRNPVMHVDAKHTTEEAKAILGAAKAFMAKVARLA